MSAAALTRWRWTPRSRAVPHAAAHLVTRGQVGVGGTAASSNNDPTEVESPLDPSANPVDFAHGDPSPVCLVTAPLCAACGAAASHVELVPPGERPASWESWDDHLPETYGQFRRVDSWRFLFGSIEAGNGLGDDAGADAMARHREVFKVPPDFDPVHAAGLYDDAGFCAWCRVADYRTHWSAQGAAESCPHGHFKSIDPHWEPDDR